MSGAKRPEMVVEYGVQPYVRERRGLKAEISRPAPGRERALRMGERLAAMKAGVVVFRRRSVPEFGEYDDPEILARHGALPEELAAA